MAALLSIALAVGCRHPSSPEAPRSAKYDLHVRIAPETRLLDVAGTVRLPAADKERTELSCSLSAGMRDVSVEIAEPSSCAGPATFEQAVQPPRQRTEGERSEATWVVRPKRAVPRGQPVVLEFRYEGHGDPGLLYYVGPEVAFASGWGDRWYPVFEGVSDARGSLAVTAPEGWTTVTGHEDSGTFTFVAGPYTRVRHDGAVPISAYLLTPRAHIDSYLEGVESMVGVLSREFGPYPFGELVLVDVPRTLAKQAGFNAFSPAGMVVLNSRAFDAEPKQLHEWLGHEIGHQWFPHAVTWDPPGFPYLEEALAEYGGLRVVEELAGPDAARRTRTIGFEYDPIYSASAYFKMVGAGADRALATMGNGIDQRNLAYNKGSLMFDMLSREVGREVFRGVLHDITRGEPFKTITWNDFVGRVSTASGRNLDGFFDQWLNRGGAPDFQLSWTQEGDTVHATVTQPTPVYRARLKVEIQGEGDRRLVREIQVEGARTDLTVQPGFHVQSVVLDPDNEVLRWTPEFRAVAAAKP